MSTVSDDALATADVVLKALKAKGLDYSQYREQIAQELFDEGLLEGNWDTTTNLGDPVLKDLHAIQEDEYDQHMDDVEDKLEWDDMICHARPVTSYIWIKK